MADEEGWVQPFGNSSFLSQPFAELVSSLPHLDKDDSSRGLVHLNLTDEISKLFGEVLIPVTGGEKF